MQSKLIWPMPDKIDLVQRTVFRLKHVLVFSSFVISMMLEGYLALSTQLSNDGHLLYYHVTTHFLFGRWSSAHNHTRAVVLGNWFYSSHIILMWLLLVGNGFITFIYYWYSHCQYFTKERINQLHQPKLVCSNFCLHNV